MLKEAVKEREVKKLGTQSSEVKPSPTKTIITCPGCSGKKKIQKRIGKGSATSLQNCDRCKGAGVVTYGKDFCFFKVMELNRKINFMWEMLQHKRPLGATFLYKLKHDCKECGGSGELVIAIKTEIRVVKCETCDGKGYTKEALAKVFEEVFKVFVELKRERDYFNELIKTETWKKPEVKYIEKLKPKKYMVVCTRCKHYLDEDASNPTPCMSCRNSCDMDKNAPINFEPITAQAAKWYRQEGHKWNFKGKF